MDEAAVKAQVLSFIRAAAGDQQPVVTAEFSLGRCAVRADLVLLADNELIGIEIKTERDTLRRLPKQLEAYSRFFDHVVLVAAPCHAKGLAGLDLFSASHWITSASGIEVIDVGLANPVSPLAHLELLTLEEKRRAVSSAATVRDHFAAAFQRRYAQTSGRFWQSCSGRDITADDIRLLSRFVDQREAAKAMASEREERWRVWNQAYGSTAAPALA